MIGSKTLFLLNYVQIAAGGWHSAAISEFADLYMFGWNESGQLALPTNLAREEHLTNWKTTKNTKFCLASSCLFK